MTFENKIKAMLFERGMFENGATAVVEIMKANKVHKPMEHRWNDNVEDYPRSVLVIL